EAASGQDYFDYVRDHVYKPAGMTDTDAYELDRDVPNLAVGYTRMGPGGRFQPGPRRNNLFLHVIKGGPAGGGYSSVVDPLRFDRALPDQALLGSRLTASVLPGKVRTGRSPDGRYAYGSAEERANASASSAIAAASPASTRSSTCTSTAATPSP